MASGKYYTVVFTAQELEDVIDALPHRRPQSNRDPITSRQHERQWGLRTDLELRKSRGPDQEAILEQ